MADYIILSPLFMPFVNVMTSLQLSVAGHKNIYGSFGDPKSKELLKPVAQMTSLEKRKYEIYIKVKQINTSQDSHPHKMLLTELLYT